MSSPFLKRMPTWSPLTRPPAGHLQRRPTQEAPDGGTGDRSRPWGALRQGHIQLEGDGALVLRCYKELSALSRAIGLKHYPNLSACASRLGSTPQEVAALKAHAMSCVEEGVHYFLEKFNLGFKVLFEHLKQRGSLSSPSERMQIDEESVQQLRHFPFLDKDDVILALLHELPQYLAEARMHPTRPTHCNGGRRRPPFLPYWVKAFSKVLLVQPSSAASERVFSLLKASFSEQQDGALEDYLERRLCFSITIAEAIPRL